MKQIFLDNLPLEEASRLLMDRVDALLAHRSFTEVVKAADSLGRITAEPVVAKYSSPSYHSSAMDGYAVRFVDTFTASEASPCLLEIGQDAFYVDTGDPMPEGFNAVVMIEDVNITKRQEAIGEGQGADESVTDYIEIYQPVTPYQSVRTIGEDIVATELIIPTNHRVRPVDIGATLASGCIEILVKRKPKVAIIPTGTELISPEQAAHGLRPPHIIDYNSQLLAGLVHELGGEPLRSPIVPDDFDAIKSAISAAVASADLVLVNAGSGRGSEDYTAQAIRELGEVVVNGVSIKPGKPFIAGFAGNKPVLGIPGYPVSAYITFELFARPLIYKMLGLVCPERKRVSALISRQIASPLGVDEFVRVKLGVVHDRHIATPISRGAGLLMSIVRADGILKVPAASEGMRAGTEVEVSLLRDREEIKNTIVCIGSHDNALDVLANILKKKHPDYTLSSAHVGSMGGLMALKRGEAHMAGTHLLDDETGTYNVPYLKKLFKENEIALINLAYREQGLLVKKGNPKGIQGFEDLVRDDLTFVNRQSGSGTRLLLDKHLRELKINPYMVKGYEREEYTHMAVASAVLTGLADTGLAIHSAAKALDLDFIPVAKERYDLAIPRELFGTEMIQAVLEILRDDKEFRDAVEALGGYDLSDMGERVDE